MRLQGMSVPAAAPSSLRTQQKELARGLIIDATARVILRTGIHQFSMQEVADEAGVSLRTLYRYHPSREALVDGVGAEIEQGLADAGLTQELHAPITPGSLATLVGDAFRITERRGADLARAWVVINMATGARSRLSRRHDRLVRDVVEDLGPHLEQSERDRVFGVIRYLASVTAWKVMRDDLGMETEELAQAVGWAIRTLLENLEGGGGPVDRH
jgi:AcrR family transcriptional regulator